MRTLLLLIAGCTCLSPAFGQFLSKGTHEGVEIAYRWHHPKGKPSELQLKLKNTTETDKRVSIAIDLFYQGLTVESFEADTCVRAGQQLTGRLNGFYFIPERISSEQIKDGSAEVEVTRTLVTNEPCH